MKPVFCVDITTNKKNETANGQEFLLRGPSESLKRELEKNAEETVKLVMKGLFSPLKIAMLVCLGLGVLIVSGIVEALGEEDGVSLAQAYANAPWLFWLGGGLLVTSAVLWVIGKLHAKSEAGKEKESAIDQSTDRGVSLVESIMLQMGVPRDAAEVDILTFSYKLKDGEVSIKRTNDSLAQCENFSRAVYVEAGNLCIADTDGIFGFPLSGLKTIHTVDKALAIWSWNKEEEHNKGIYKDYKLKKDSEDNIRIKPYHILELEHGGEEWGIWFPCYELPVIEQLTGLKAK